MGVPAVLLSAGILLRPRQMLLLSFVVIPMAFVYLFPECESEAAKGDVA